MLVLYISHVLLKSQKEAEHRPRNGRSSNGSLTLCHIRPLEPSTTTSTQAHPRHEQVHYSRLSAHGVASVKRADTSSATDDQRAEGLADDDGGVGGRRLVESPAASASSASSASGLRLVGLASPDLLLLGLIGSLGGRGVGPNWCEPWCEATARVLPVLPVPLRAARLPPPPATRLPPPPPPPPPPLPPAARHRSPALPDCTLRLSAPPRTRRDILTQCSSGCSGCSATC